MSQEILVNVGGTDLHTSVLLADDVAYVAANYVVKDFQGEPIEVSREVDAALIASSRTAQELALWDRNEYFTTATSFIDWYQEQLDDALGLLQVQIGAQAVFDTAVGCATAIAGVHLGGQPAEAVASFLIDTGFGVLDAENDLVVQTFHAQYAKSLFAQARELIDSAAPVAAAIPQGFQGYETGDLEMQAAGDALNRGIALYQHALNMTVQWFSQFGNAEADAFADVIYSIAESAISLIPNGGEIFGDVATLVGQVEDVSENAEEMQALIDALLVQTGLYSVENFSYFSDVNQEAFALVSDTLNTGPSDGEGSDGGPEAPDPTTEPEGLAAHYAFDGNLTDGAGSADARMIGTEEYVVGRNGTPGDALHVSDDNYAEVPKSVAFTPGTSAFSVVIDFKVNDFYMANNQPFPASIFTIQGGDFREALTFRLDSNGSYVAIFNDGGSTVSHSFDGGAELEEWQHVVAVIDPTTDTASFYVNGSMASQMAYPLNGGIDGGWELILGGYSYSSARNGHDQVVVPDMDLDDIRFYNRALTADEAMQLYPGDVPEAPEETPPPPLEGLIAHYSFDDATNLGDDTASANHDGTVIGVTGSDGVVGGAASFDGTDRIEVPITSDLKTGYYTTSFWVRPGEGGDPAGTILDNRFETPDTLNNAGYEILFGDANGLVGVSQFTSSVGNHGANTGVRIDDGAWHHVAATWDGSLSRVYVDGVLADSFDAAANGYASGPIRFSGPPEADIWIGDSNYRIPNGGRGAYAGDLDELRIYDRALSADEVIDLYAYEVAGGSGGSGGGSGNEDPPIANPDAFEVAENGTLTFSAADLLANDEGTSPTVGEVSADSLMGSLVDNGDGSYSYGTGDAFDTLAAGESAVTSFNYVATNSGGSSDSAEVSITVLGVNDGPTAASLTLAASENGLTVTGSFAGDDIDSDDDAASLGYSITGQPTEGTVTNNGDGTFAFDPGTALHELAAGELREVTWGYTAIDRHGAVSDPATVTVSVAGVNDGPTATSVVAATSEDGPAVVGTFAGSDIDSDDDSGSLTYKVVAGGSAGLLSNNDDGTFGFDPGSSFQELAAGETREVVYYYTATDRHGAASNEAQLTVTITGANDGPTAAAAEAVAVEDGAIIVGSFAGDDIDSDDDSASLSYSIIGQAAEGTVVNNGDGTFSFDPGSAFQELAADETRQVSFEYTATDRHGAVSAPALVAVTVSGENDDPIANADAVAVDEDGSVTIDVLANDTDIDASDELQIVSLDTSGTRGSATVAADGRSIVYSADAADFDLLQPGETAIDVVTYQVADGNGGSSATTATFTVGYVDDGTLIDVRNGRGTIEGTGGEDTIFAGNGRGLISAGDGADLVYGENGADTIHGGESHDVLYGNQGTDVLDGGIGNDTLKGGKADDTLFGGAGDDVMYGNLGADRLDGGDGDDMMKGGRANDTLSGGAGDDALYGNLGADFLDGGEGDDLLLGGRGADVFSIAAGDGIDVIADFEVNRDLLSLVGVQIQSEEIADFNGDGTLDTRLDLGEGQLVTLLAVSSSSDVLT